jgi:uncharacterized membrane protein
MEIIYFIVTVVLSVFVLNLRARVEKLELIIKKGMVGQPAHQPQAPTSESEIAPPLGVIQPPSTQSLPTMAPEVDFENKFIKWLKEDWLLKLGAMLLLIGFGWLTTYAFMNNWIGPMGRIVLGLLAGVVFLIIGWWRIKKYINQGGVFLVLGSTVVLLTTFAAREIYNFFTPSSALALMFLSTVFVAINSVKYKSRALALSGLVLAGIAPLLTNSTLPDYNALFAYLLVVTLGVIWVVAISGMRELTVAALILVSSYSFPHLVSFIRSDKTILLLFVYAFSTLFFLTSIMGILRSRDKKITADVLTAMGNGIFLLAWVSVAAQDEWKSLIMAAWTLVFLIGAFLVFKVTQRKEPFYIYAGVGLAMLAAATAMELEGASLTIAYTVESALVPLIAWVVLRNIKIAERLSLLLVGPVALSFSSINSFSWKTDGFLNKDFFVLFNLGLILMALGLIFWLQGGERKDKESEKFGSILMMAGSVYGYVLLWLSLPAAHVSPSSSVMICLAVYTVIGLIAYFYGLANEKNGLRLYGGILVGFVVARLLIIDVWKMEMSGRIITFFVIGAMLVSTAFLGRRNKNKPLASDNNIKV